MNLDDLKEEADDFDIEIHFKKNEADSDKTKIKQIQEKNQINLLHNDERSSIKSKETKSNYKEREKEKHQKPNEYNQFNQTNTKKEKSNEHYKQIKLREDLLIADHLDLAIQQERQGVKDNSKFTKNTDNKKPYNNYCHSESDSNEDSFDNKVKTLQKDKINRIKSEIRNNSIITNKNSIHNNNSLINNQNNYSSNKSKTLESVKNIRSVSKTKFKSNPNEKTEAKKLRKNESVKKLNTIVMPSKSKTKNNLMAEFNNDSTQNMKSEIINLRKEVGRLKLENKKIKDLLDKERESNKMYKDFSEELIKQYE